MTDQLPNRTANGAGHGPARGYSWPAFTEANSAARKHGLHSHFLMVEGKEEIAQTADLLRSLLPTYATAFEPMLQVTAARLWRLRGAYEYVGRTPPGERSKAFEESMNALENLVSRSFAALGLTPQAAAELGVNLQRLAAGSEDGQPPFNWNALDPGERKQLSALLAKGRRADAV